MGASSGLMMAGSTAAQGVSSIGGAYAQSQAIQAQGAYQSRVAQTNADLSNIRAQDAIDAGNFEANVNDMKTRESVGSQRAHLASQGIDVNTGSAAQVQSDTAAIGALDSLTIRNNAMKQAFGYQIQALNDTYSGKFAGMTAGFNANNTLLTGGMSALADFGKAGYYGYRGSSPSTPPSSDYGYSATDSDFSLGVNIPSFNYSGGP